MNNPQNDESTRAFLEELVKDIESGNHAGFNEIFGVNKPYV